MHHHDRLVQPSSYRVGFNPPAPGTHLAWRSRMHCGPLLGDGGVHSITDWRTSSRLKVHNLNCKQEAAKEQYGTQHSILWVFRIWLTLRCEDPQVPQLLLQSHSSEHVHLEWQPASDIQISMYTHQGYPSVPQHRNKIDEVLFRNLKILWANFSTQYWNIMSQNALQKVVLSSVP